jgi:hypothetical protein
MLQNTYNGSATRVQLAQLPSVDVRFIQDVKRNPYYTAKERALLLRGLRAYSLHIRVKHSGKYRINARLLAAASSSSVLDVQRAHTVLCLHGFGKATNWIRWTKLAAPLHAAGFNVLFVDLPGFGTSSGRNIQTRTWKCDGPEILLGILDALALCGTVSLHAVCGGAATFMRTLVKYPARFRHGRHVLHNCITSVWEPRLDAMLRKHTILLLITWIEDCDHSRHSVSYKTLSRISNENKTKKNKKNSGIRFVELDADLGALQLHAIDAPGMGRCGCNKTLLYEPAASYVAQMVKWHTPGAAPLDEVLQDLALQPHNKRRAAPMPKPNSVVNSSDHKQ